MARRLKPTDTIIELARAKMPGVAALIIDELSRSELIIYINLLAIAGTSGMDTIKPTNAEIYRGDDARTCNRALLALEAHGLVKLSFDSKKTRTIVVVTK